MSKNKKKIKDKPKSERPREKLAEQGTSLLRDEELLAILLGSGHKNKNALELAKYFLNKFELSKLLSLDYKELIELKGIGSAKASTIKAVEEIIERIADKGTSSKVEINTAEDAFAQVEEIINKKQEHLISLFLNARNELITKEIITIGTLKANLISPREIFAKALDNSAAYIVLAHNHPSRNHTPSDEDLEITKKVVEAGELMDIRVLDHIIVSNEGFTSIKRMNNKFFN